MCKKEEKKYCTAIILSAGRGKRMGADVQKQYIELEGEPVISHTLRVFQDSQIIDEVILVVGAGDVGYAQKEIVEKYGFSKVHTIVEGGKERYDSVWKGLQVIQHNGGPREKEGFVFIHDGARMFVNEEILGRGYQMVEKFRACVAGMPSKDTIKIADEEGFARQTPERNYVWTVQTPQVFDSELIIEAYSRLMQSECRNVTDDAMAVEQMMDVPVKLFEGSYENIKLTTPGDLEIAKTFLAKNKKRC